ncbi:MAG TPA: proton-conducting transporter membrane subunit [Candidatus Acidoferrales bacterium]|nr:proton-conducting transporter membrane subunit [Candidatus Acidoferrales bacterium]
MAWLAPLLLAPLLAAIAVLALGRTAWPARLALLGSGGTLAAAIALAARVERGGAFPAADGRLRADALGAVIAVLIALVAFAGAIERDAERPDGAPRKDVAPGSARRREALELALLACLLAASFADSIALAALALLGAMLLAAGRLGSGGPAATAATARPLLVGGAGATLALFAAALLAHAGNAAGAPDTNISGLLAVAPRLDASAIRAAFALALVGLGALAGLVPLAAWLPETSVHVDSTLAATLSAGAAAAAFVPILRVHALVAASGCAAWADGALALAGLLAMLVATPRILVQDDARRLLAWSGIAQLGFAAFSLGLGTPLAAFAGLLHLLLQSLARTAAFLAGGRLQAGIDAARPGHAGGALAGSPALGGAFAGALVALAGLPPAGTFVSQWLALAGGFASPLPLARGATVAALVLLVAGFAGLSFHGVRAVLGSPRTTARLAWPLRSRVAIGALLALVLLAGAGLPAALSTLIEQAARGVQP